MTKFAPALLVLAAALFCPSRDAHAQAQPQRPVDYARVCSAYGANYMYVPGTDTCLDPLTGQTRRETVDGTVAGRTELAARIDAAGRRARDAYREAGVAVQGAALAMAMPSPFVPDGHSFAVAGTVAAFEDVGTVGVAAAYKLRDNVLFTVGGSFTAVQARGADFSAAGRAGVNFNW